MPDIKDLLPSTPDEDRIRKWREERLRIAEEEKAERLRLRDVARSKDAQDRADQEAEAAAKLLPSLGDIAKAKREITKRQTRMRLRNIARFGIICLLPLIAAGMYLTHVATPLYEARSVIAVTKPQTSGDTSNSGLLGSLSSASGLQEVFMAHEFIRSKAMMDALETDSGLVTQLTGPAIDPVQRLRDMPMLAITKQDQFSRFVESAVDIQTGLITLYVRTPEPSESVIVSDRILALVAAQVNTLNGDVVDQRLALAERAVETAQDQLTKAQTDLISLQLSSGEADPAERIAGVYNLINQLEAEALNLNNDVQRAEVAGQGESFQTQRAVALQDRLQTEIASQRALLVSDGKEGAASLNALMMQYELAELRVTIAEEALTASLAAQVEATNTAALASSLFQVVVPPRTSDVPSAPNAPGILIIIFAASLSLFAFWSATFSGRQIS